jgi:hypothetical protein
MRSLPPVNATRMAYTGEMGRRMRGGLAAATAFLAVSCALVAPLGGLSGDAPPQTDDATSAHADADAADALPDHPADATAEEHGDEDAGLESATMDAPADTRVDDADAGMHDDDAAASDAGADVTKPDAPADAPTDAPPDAPSSVYRAAVLADAPLAYWRLGEKSGTVAHDETGHGYDGTYTGTYTLGAAGALAGDPDTAVTLDGVTGQVDVGDNFDFAGQVPFSFEAWVKPAVIDSVYRHVVTKMAFNGFGNPQVGTYVILQQGNTILGFERWQDAATELTVETSSYPAAGSWAHVVATYNGSVGELYVNGVAVQASAGVGGVTASGVHMLWGNVLQGVIDEIAVYDHVLSAARVAAHHQAAL